MALIRARTIHTLPQTFTVNPVVLSSVQIRRPVYEDMFPPKGCYQPTWKCKPTVQEPVGLLLSQSRTL